MNSTNSSLVMSRCKTITPIKGKRSEANSPTQEVPVAKKVYGKDLMLGKSRNESEKSSHLSNTFTTGHPKSMLSVATRDKGRAILQRELLKSAKANRGISSLNSKKKPDPRQKYLLTGSSSARISPLQNDRAV